MISDYYQKSSWESLGEILTAGSLLKKMPKVLVMILLATLGGLIAYTGGLKLSAIAIVGIVALPVVLTTVWMTQIGIYIMVTFAFFLSVALRLIPQVPIGMAIDLLVLLMVMGKVYRMQFNRDWSPMKSPLTIVLLVWMVYNLAQIVNPWAASRAAWFYVIRPAVGYLMLYFMIWDSAKSIRQVRGIYNYILFLAFVAGVWGIYQFFFGYFGWEMSYILKNDTVHLVFINGRWRSLGPIGSPMQYGLIMAVTSCIAFNGIFHAKSLSRKLWLVTVFLACLLGMVYSGTRAAYVIIPVFYFAKVIISRSKKWYFSLIFAGLGLFVLATVPTNNYQIQRIQSVFKAKEDKSFQIREQNRKMIMPWIAKHPIGGGLGSTGVWGQRFSPGTFLANFPPDSGIIRVAVELGWIGLIIFLSIYVVAFFKGVRGYWKSKKTENKEIIEGVLCMLPALGVVEMAQEVAGVFPMSILFWAFLAILFTTLKLENKPNAQPK